VSGSTSFIEIVKSYLNSDNVQLPVFNPIALKIQREITKEEPDFRKVEQLITNDQALTSEVLKVANSSFYKGFQEITSVKNAIVRLGGKEVSNIVTLVTHENHFHSKDQFLHKIMRSLWRHSVGCAVGSHWLAQHCGMPGAKHESFFAGLLHDVGKLLVLKVADKLMTKNELSVQVSDALLTEAMDALHTDFGYALMKNWNIPEKYSEIARQHHTVDFDSKDILLVIVRLADRACNKLGIGMKSDFTMALMATPEANELRLTEVDIANFEIYLEDTSVAKL
jgi:HD-like signal output (HDOD) protein